jgi:S1-C subfamily serine protease
VGDGASGISLIHLSGPRRGQTDDIRELPVSIGSDPGLEVVIPGVAGNHALLVERHGEVVLEDGGSALGTLLLGEPVREAVLRDGDVIELGSGGPKLRFRREGADPVSLMRALVWARPVGAPALSDTTALIRTLVKETTARTSRLFRIAMAALVVVGALAFAAGEWQARRLRAEVARLNDAVATAKDEQRLFMERVLEERRRAAEERRGLEARIEEARAREESLSRQLAEGQAAEAQAVRRDLEATRERLAALESERAAGERIIRDYGAGVCLIQGSYAFYDDQGQGLRVELAADGNPRRKDDGNVALSTAATGPLYTVDYLGTGFLVDRRGFVLTNRHVAEPWWGDAAAQSLIDGGAKPRFVIFRAFFPKEAESFALATERVSDQVDLALVRLNPRKRPIPVLLLDTAGKGAVAGQAVVVLGYPAGLEALLAKADNNLVQEMLRTTGTSSDRVTEAMGRRGLIRPSTTQGHIGDITKTDIVFDAPTTQGGSGGPVLNRSGRVIAVEYAVLTRFEGSSFGVPIGYALELMKTPRKTAGD